MNLSILIIGLSVFCSVCGASIIEYREVRSSPKEGFKEKEYRFVISEDWDIKKKYWVGPELIISDRNITKAIMEVDETPVIYLYLSESGRNSLHKFTSRIDDEETLSIGGLVNGKLQIVQAIQFPIKLEEWARLQIHCNDFTEQEVGKIVEQINKKHSEPDGSGQPM